MTPKYRQHCSIVNESRVSYIHWMHVFTYAGVVWEGRQWKKPCKKRCTHTANADILILSILLFCHSRLTQYRVWFNKKIFLPPTFSRWAHQRQFHNLFAQFILVVGREMSLFFSSSPEHIDNNTWVVDLFIQNNSNGQSKKKSPNNKHQ